MKKLLLLLVVLFFATVVCAVDPSFYFKKDEPVSLVVPCNLQGAVCAGSASCNVTVVNPLGEFVVLNQVMENHYSYFNYSVSAGIVYLVGDYSVLVSCIDGSYSDEASFLFNISESGVRGYGSYIVLGLTLFAMVILILAGLVGRIPILSLFGFVCGVVFGVMIMSFSALLGVIFIVVDILFFIYILDTM